MIEKSIELTCPKCRRTGMSNDMEQKTIGFPLPPKGLFVCSNKNCCHFFEADLSKTIEEK